MQKSPDALRIPSYTKERVVERLKIHTMKEATLLLSHCEVHARFSLWKGGEQNNNGVFVINQLLIRPSFYQPTIDNRVSVFDS